MKHVILVLNAVVLATTFFIISILLGTVIGAFAGWLLSITFLGDWVISGFAVFGIDAKGKLVIIGAVLGFLSGFFRDSSNTQKSS